MKLLQSRVRTKSGSYKVIRFLGIGTSSKEMDNKGGTNNSVEDLLTLNKAFRSQKCSNQFRGYHR